MSKFSLKLCVSLFHVNCQQFRLLFVFVVGKCQKMKKSHPRKVHVNSFWAYGNHHFAWHNSNGECSDNHGTISNTRPAASILVVTLWPSSITLHATVTAWDKCTALRKLPSKRFGWIERYWFQSDPGKFTSYLEWSGGTGDTRLRVF